MTRSLVLFTRDLRVHENAALSAATRGADEVIPLFVLDRALLAGSCGAPNRVAFLLESLRDLDHSLAERGGGLIIRRGDAVEETLALVARFAVSTIHMSADAGPYGEARRRRLAEGCERLRVALSLHPGVNVVAPGELTPQGGDHYRVFTPYWRAWRHHERPPSARAPRAIRLPEGLSRAGSEEFEVPTRGTRSPTLAAGGETAGRRRLASWLGSGLERYDALHDDLAGAATSQLSAYLHFGCLSPLAVLERCERGERAAPEESLPGKGAEDFARQLCWRDFHHQVLAARPDLPRADYRTRGDRWHQDDDAAAAWRAGLTGYPIVDAGMRQLAQEGFMHNRARLIVASFLTKTLYLDWRLGAAHFARLLLDADVANNVGNWQWVAGTGNDTRPNRVLNPLRQAARFDPHGDYVRRYLPELGGIDGAAVHEPWLLPARARRGLDYPDRLIDHRDGAERLRRGRYGSSTPS